jgi:hypothetical protein
MKIVKIWIVKSILFLLQFSRISLEMCHEDCQDVNCQKHLKLPIHFLFDMKS